MNRTDILRFYAYVPVWFWPILWWSLSRVNAEFARRQAAGESVLAEITGNEYGLVRIRWVSVTPNPVFVPHDGPSPWELQDLDAYARAFALATWPVSATRRARQKARVIAPNPTFSRLEPG